MCAGQTPLHLAVLLNDLKMIEILIGAGAELNIKNYLGLRPFELPCNSEIKQKLIHSELLVAAWHNDIKAVKELVEKGYSIHSEIRIQVWRFQD